MAAAAGVAAHPPRRSDPQQLALRRGRQLHALPQATLRQAGASAPLVLACARDRWWIASALFHLILFQFPPEAQVCLPCCSCQCYPVFRTGEATLCPRVAARQHPMEKGRGRGGVVTKSRCKSAEANCADTVPIFRANARINIVNIFHYRYKEFQKLRIHTGLLMAPEYQVGVGDPFLFHGSDNAQTPHPPPFPYPPGFRGLQLANEGARGAQSYNP